MRPTLLLLATAASCVPATKIGCPQHLFEELVTRTSCGDNKSISKCLRSDIDLGRLDEIEQCYIAGGCSKADATVGAVWFAHEYLAEVREEGERQDLRRRADSSDTNSDSATQTTEKTTAKTTAKTTEKTSEKTTAKTTESSAAASSTAAPSSAAASTTSDSTTSDSTTASSTTETTASSTTASSTTTTTSSSSSTTGTGKVTTTGTLLCSTTNTVQTSMCFVTSGTTASCVPTTALLSTCAAGNLCMTNSAGEDTCMKIDNTVGPGGIAVAIIFGSAIAAVTVGLFVMNAKANSAAKRREAQHAAFMAGYPSKGRSKAADVEAFRDGPQAGSEANLPLISEPGAQGYGGQEFVDYGRRAPQLHQGLGALS